MPSSPASNLAFSTGSITTALPSDLSLRAEGLYQILGNTSLATHPGIEIKVCGEDLVIPYRIHHEGDEQEYLQLNGLQSVMYSCVLTRHHDGHIRHRQLKQILSVSEPWVVPFVMQLTGEYVMEILDTCEAHLPTLNQELYGDFIKDNPKYFKALQDRMISYWDCYYRHLYKYRQDYVGFRLFEHFRTLARE
ncbi:hypothetical protein B0E42_25625 [Pseudomonas sp. A25(2017)]|nr:hypothetical protein B0E42_25625 [Pseudomonas sp. A25(2017)]